MPTDFDRDVYCIAGLPFDAITLKQSFQQVYRAILNRETCFLSTPNLNFLIACQTDQAFRHSVINSDLSIADGMPIVWMAKLMGIPVTERVAGSSLFDYLGSVKSFVNSRATGDANPDNAPKRIKVFFFGGEEGVAQLACDTLSRKLPGMQCVGFINPGFVPVEQLNKPEYLQQINDSGADFLLVALGAQKGQGWLEANRSGLEVPVYSHLGAVINFVSGSVRRAPPWAQKTGFEWLWRIKEEPGLWKRYWVDGLGFLKILLTRVFPYALFTRFSTQKASRIQPQITVRHQAGKVSLAITGDCSVEYLETIRQAFSGLNLSSLPGKSVITVDVAGVVYLDSAFIGLLLLLKKQSLQNEFDMLVVNASGRVKRVFYWCGAGYLLE